MNTLGEEGSALGEQRRRSMKSECSLGDCCTESLASFRFAHNRHPPSLSRTLELLPWLSAEPAVDMHMGVFSAADQILAVPQSTDRTRPLFYPPMSFSYKENGMVPFPLPLGMPLALPFAPPPLPPQSSSASAGDVAGAVASRRRSRGEKKPTPEDQKDQRYLERRRRNNTAAKKSRDARRAREDQIALRASILEHENAVLRAQLLALRSESDNLRTLIYSRRGEASEGSLSS